MAVMDAAVMALTVARVLRPKLLKLNVGFP